MIYLFAVLLIVVVYLGGAAGTYRYYMSTVLPGLRFREERDAMLAAFVWPLFWLIVGFMYLAAGLQNFIRYLSGIK